MNIYLQITIYFKQRMAKRLEIVNTLHESKYTYVQIRSVLISHNFVQHKTALLQLISPLAH